MKSISLGHDLMVVKVKGEFRWHKHDGTDAFFLVLLGPGEMSVIEPTGTPNTGDAKTAAPRRVI